MGCFCLSFLNCSGGSYTITTDVCLGLSGPASVFGLIDGPMPLPLIFYCRRPLGFICLGPSKQSLKLWAWSGVAEKKTSLHIYPPEPKPHMICGLDEYVVQENIYIYACKL